MRRHAKAPSAGSTLGQGSSLGSVRRALATRGASHDADGSGAPSHRSVFKSSIGLVALLLLALAPAAQGATGVTNVFGSTGTLGGQFSATTGVGGVAVNENGTGGANAGDTYVVDRGNNRIERFSATGAFISAWGKDVVTGGGTGYEVCTVASECKAAATSTGLGGEMNTPQGVTVDQSTGNVYVTDQGNIRVQEFSATGAFIRAFGAGVTIGGATGTGNITTGSAEVTTVVTTSKAFAVGQTVTGEGIPANTRITTVTTGAGAASKLILSQAATETKATTLTVAEGTGNNPTNEIQTVTLPSEASSGNFKLKFTNTSPTSEGTTANIPYNASPAAVQTALEALTATGLGAGQVSVTSPNPGGGAAPGGPYVVEFKGSRFADTNVAQMTQVAGSPALSTGSATIATTAQGASGPEVCTQAAACKAGVEGTVAGGAFTSTFSGFPAFTPAGSPNAGNLLVPDPGNRRVQEFTPAGVFIRAFGWDVVSSGPDDSSANEEQKITVKADGGTFTVTFSGQTTPPLAYNIGAAELQSKLNALFSIGGTSGSVTVTGGPGDAGGTSPYTVIFGGSLGGDDVAQMTTGTTNLTLSSGTKSATVTTATPGGAFEVCKASGPDVCKTAGAAGAATGQFAASTPTQVTEDTSGNLYTLEPTTNFRVQKFTLPGNVVTAQGVFDGADLNGTTSENAPATLAADPTSGSLYVSKAFVKGSGTPAAEKAEQRILKISSAGSLQEAILAQVGLTVNGIGINGASSQLLVSSPTESQRVFIVGSIPASVAATFNAEMDSPGVTNITTEGATFHGIVTPGQGITIGTKYRFEYTDGFTWTEGPLVDIGNGSGTGNVNSCPTENPPTCIVTLAPTTLLTGQQYKVRIKAFIPFHPEIPPVVSEYVKFTTTPSAPSAKTGNAWWSSPTDTAPSLLLTGFVNPKSEPTTFYFQYVTEEKFDEAGYEEATSIPTPPGEPAAASFNTVEVQQPVYELDSAKTYHYRIVAQNATGTTFGEDRTLSPPNPGDRFYELVSSGSSAGLGISRAGKIAGVADVGNRLMFNAQVMNDPEASTGLQTPQISERGADGWHVTTMSPDPEHSHTGLVGIFQAAPDFSRLLFESIGAGEEVDGQRRYQFASLNGTRDWASPLIQPLTYEMSGSWFENSHLGYYIKGASANLSRFLFQVENSFSESRATFVPNEPLSERPNLYEVNAESQTVTMVNRSTAGNPIGGMCGARLGSYVKSNFPPAPHAISSDGSVVYFSAKPGVPYSGTCSTAIENEFGSRIFKRVNDSATTEVSASQCNRPALPEPPGPCKAIAGDDTYFSASDDGSTVFFSSPRQLTNSDVDTGTDLYVYDSSPPGGEPTLVQATAGEATVGHPTVGSGSGFQGVVDTSSDGSRVYFVATGQLTAAATQGANNLFVYERDASHPAGRLSFIGTLSAGDSQLWTAGATKEAHVLPAFAMDEEGNYSFGDGHFLVFTSTAKLVSEDLDSSLDLYRYDDQTSELNCLSCTGNGEFPVRIMGNPTGSADPAAAQEGRVANSAVTDIVFCTAEALLPSDHNTTMDVYEWREGQMILISKDTGNLGTATFLGTGTPPSISQDGKDVYFATEARLVPSDRDTDAATDIYDARIGGGFPAPKPEARICANGEICRGATTEPPKPLSNESTTFSGPGNPQPANPSKPRCRRGTARRHGKCVRVKKHRQGHHKRRNNKGGKA